MQGLEPSNAVYIKLIKGHYSVWCGQESKMVAITISEHPLHVRDYARLYRNYISFNSHNCNKIYVASSFYKWINKGFNKLSNLSRKTCW